MASSGSSIGKGTFQPVSYKYLLCSLKVLTKVLFPGFRCTHYI